MIPRGGAILLGVALVLLGPTAASAQAPAADGESQAREAFAAGQSAFRAGRYDDALREFSEARRLSDRPEIVYDVALAADRLGELALALESYQAFLVAEPETPLRAEIESRIHGLEAEIARAGARPSGEPPPPVVTTRTEGGWLFTWIALGTAIGAGVASGVSWALASDAYGGLERSCAPDCSASQIAASDVELRVTLTNAFGVASAILGAAAVVLFFVEMPHTVTGSSSARLGVGPLGVSFEIEL